MDCPYCDHACCWGNCAECDMCSGAADRAIDEGDGDYFSED